ncbi:MAG: hypothetical protein RSB05_00170 [Clostridiales bacterium]
MKPKFIESFYNLGELPKYTTFSLIATALDFSVVWAITFLLHGDIVFANTIGSLSGFFLHYFLASKTVFNTEYGAIGFVIYLSTFLLGMIIGNIIIYYTYHWLLTIILTAFAFIISKILSVSIPFFIVYYLRMLIFKRLDNSDNSDNSDDKKNNDTTKNYEDNSHNSIN